MKSHFFTDLMVTQKEKALVGVNQMDFSKLNLVFGLEIGIGGISLMPKKK